MTTSRSYFRIMAGRKSVHAGTCHEEGFIGGDWGIAQDLSGQLPDE